jgi:2-C-methyl-D-erythritol 4-phosphate cytidylyltransferase
VELVEETIAVAERYGAAVAAQEVTDTIKSTVDGVMIDQHLDRGTLRSVQTPQTFKVSVIERALAAAMAAGRSLTDDTAACQAIGQDVRFVISTEPNIKITHPGDLAMAEHFLKPW